MFVFALQLLLLGVSPFVYYGLGRVFFRLVLRLLRPLLRRCEGKVDGPWPAVFMLGLLGNLVIIFFLRSVGISWPFAVALSLFPGALEGYKAFRVLRQRLFSALSLHYCVWFLVILPLGLSLFNVNGGITTPWINNYGDLTFHLGTITSFVFGDNIPPEYHIFPGARLSYPFLVNLWSASLWAMHPAYYSLSLIFIYQWLLLWTVVYYALNGDRQPLLPWAVLFGGGTYYYVYHSWLRDLGVDLSAGAHVLIGKGYPWTPFISTIWVTQRPALLGTAAILSSLSCYYRFVDPGREANGEKKDVGYLVLSSSVLALSVLAHTHLFLVGTMFIGLHLLFTCLPTVKASGIGNIRLLLLFSLPFTASFIFAPWLMGKSGIAKFTGGWMPWMNESVGKIQHLLGACAMWANNAPQLLIFFCLLFLVSKRIMPFLILAALFITANLIQLAVWEWDQIKVFLGLYLIGVSLPLLERPRRAVLAIPLLLLMVPGAYELANVLSHYQESTIYSSDDIRLAEEVRALTEPKSVILAKPDHNSLVTLTGRRMFLGYEGTLSSHLLPYEGRKALMGSLEEAARCTEELREEKACPDYLLWTDREKQFWHLALPEPKHVFIPVTQFLYRIRLEPSGGSGLK